jgi:hypothetical protein
MPFCNVAVSTGEIVPFVTGTMTGSSHSGSFALAP